VLVEGHQVILDSNSSGREWEREKGGKGENRRERDERKRKEREWG